MQLLIIKYEVTNYVAPEPDGSLPYSQEPTTAPYPEPTESNLHHLAYLAMSHPDYIVTSVPQSLSGLFSMDLPTKTLHTFLSSPTCATCTDHLNVLDLICLMISVDEYKLQCSSLCNFLHSPITSSL
jgi:hypothetical protein